MGRRRGKSWPLKLCTFWAGLICLTAANTEETTAYSGETKESPSVQPSCSFPQNKRNLVVVSTLDGQVAALDPRDEGQLKWSISTGRPLLSSSITRLEINRNGILTRLIPALDGGLYQFDGKTIEAVPFTADTLLSSSFRLNEDSTVVGGKETETYGVDVKTGKIKYICTQEGCQRFGETVSDSDDILVVSRNSKTVRAVELKTGQEKWNFSVGQHMLDYKKGTREAISDHSDQSDDDSIHILSCNPVGNDWMPVETEQTDSAREADTDIQLKLVVPSGLVTAVKKSDPTTILWQHKFSSAIASAWTLMNGELREINLFDEKHVPALSDTEHDAGSGMGDIPGDPLLYIGVHQEQLYVLPSVQLRSSVSSAATRALYQATLKMPRIRWQPYLATAPSRTPSMLAHKDERLRIGWSHPPEDSDDGAGDDEFGLVPWHQQYPFDTGYYLYSERTPMRLTPDSQSEDNKTKQNVSNSHDEDLMDDMAITLWNWWKEVVAISLLTSVLVQVICSRIHNQLLRPELPLHRVPSSTEGTNSSKEQSSESTEEAAGKQPGEDKSENYISRYLTDFEQEECLGKGGFGVVFQARNKVDDHSYAIKRIALNNSDRAREKVMREVKALARLEHHCIVRYYQAWFEKPPPGWQEEQDRQLEDTCPSTPVYSTSNPTTPSRAPSVHQVSAVPSLTDQLMKPFGGLDYIPEAPESAGMKRGSSSGFVPRKDVDPEDESGSYSCGRGSPARIPFTHNNEDSLDIVFEHSETDRSDSQTNSVSNTGKPVPFYLHGAQESDHSGSLDIIFEDSGCGDKSSNSSHNDNGNKGIHESSDSGEPKGERSRKSSRSKSSNETVISMSTERPSHLHLGLVPGSTAPGSTAPGSLVPGSLHHVHAAKVLTPVPKQYLYIQMQLCRKESLKDWLNENTLNRDRNQLLDIFYQIVSAVDYVHDSGLMHRDLKPSNIFFAMDGAVKVGDFGLVTPLEERCDCQEWCECEENGASQGSRRHTDQVGTKLYMSPEQVAGKTYSHKVDIFSLGMILFELFYPFSTQMERIRTLMDAKRQVLPDRFTRELQAESTLTKQLLAYDPEERPSTQEILGHQVMSRFLESQPSVPRLHHRNRSRTISNSSDKSNPKL